MSSFTTAFVTETIGEKCRWKVARAFTFEVGKLGSGVFVTVPEGFRTDGASVPRFLWWIWPPFNGLYDAAVAMHDFLYQTQAPFLTRAVPDGLLLDAMIALKVPRFDRTCIWAGVRLGGWWTYLKYRRAAARRAAKG